MRARPQATNGPNYNRQIWSTLYLLHEAGQPVGLAAAKALLDDFALLPENSTADGLRFNVIAVVRRGPRCSAGRGGARVQLTDRLGLPAMPSRWCAPQEISIVGIQAFLMNAAKELSVYKPVIFVVNHSGYIVASSVPSMELRKSAAEGAAQQTIAATGVLRAALTS